MKKLFDDFLTIHDAGNSISKSMNKCLDKESLEHLSSIH